MSAVLGPPGPAPAEDDARVDAAVRHLVGLRRRRTARRQVVATGLGVLALGTCLLALYLGDLRLPVGDVLRAVVSDEPGPATFVVRELRLPRMLLGALVGVAFGLAGALFQSVLRNPLASPDVIGISQGASAAAVAALLVGGLSGWPVFGAALVGGLAVGLLLYAVAWRQGLTGQRFVLAGIGVAYACASVVGYVLTRADVRDAQGALVWLTGSLGQATWPLVQVLAVALAVLVPVTVLVVRGLELLLLGDERAGGLGLRPERTRAVVLLLGIALAALGTAATGPIAFVAFVAGPVARRLVADGTSALLASALVGLVLVVGADQVSQHLLPGDLAVPVGVVTSLIGGPFLIWLLATGRARSA